MQLFSWLHQRVAGRKHTKFTANRGPARRFRPQLEVLEGRDVPSTLHVTNLNDSGPGSLRYEIAQAQSGDTITFKVPGTIALSSRDGELRIDKSLTIKGPGANELTISGSSGPRVFEVDYGATVTISGLTISNGGADLSGEHPGYGGGILNDGVLSVSGCAFSNNSELYGGGAIANFGIMTVSGCTVSGSFADSPQMLGGGIYNAGVMTVSNSAISGQVFLSGGTLIDGAGIYNAGSMTVSGCTLWGNATLGNGGGIYNAGAASALTVLDSIFSNNSPDNIYGPYTDGGGNSFQ